MVGLVVLQATIAQPAEAFTLLQAAKASIGSPDTPQQLGGSADGHSGKVSAAETSRHAAGAEGKHAPGPGELPQAAGDQPLQPQASADARRSEPAKIAMPPDSQTPTAHNVQRTAQTKDRNPSFHGRSATDTTSLPGPAADSQEVVDARTRDSATFVNDDGTKTTRVYARPVHYKKPDGSWANIDTTFKTSTGGRWIETANSQDVSFAARADDASLVNLAVDANHRVSYSLLGATGVKATAQGDILTYPLAAPSTDVVYNGLAAGIKETLVLHDANAPTGWVFPLNLAGLTASVGDLGDLQFKDETGTVRLTMPRGSMEDAAVDVHTGQGATSTGVTYSLTTVGGKPALRMDLDTAWLHDKARAFPVRVDPTSSGTVAAGQTTFVESGPGGFNGNNSASAELRVGTYDWGTHVDNSYLYFPAVATSLHNQFVLGVNLHITNTHSWNCDYQKAPRPVYVSQIDSPWNPSTISGFPGLTIGQQLGVNTVAFGVECTTGVQDEVFALGLSQTDPGSQLVNSWTHDGANYGLALTTSSTDSNDWKKFDSVNTAYPPYLEVTYAEWAATYATPTSVTLPTATLPGSQQVTMTNAAGNWWNSSTMQVKPRFFDSQFHEQFPAANVPLTGVPGLVKTGETVSFNAPIPPIPPGQTYQMCWDGYVNGTTSLSDSYKVKFGPCTWVQAQNTVPQIDTALPLRNSVVGILSPELYATAHDPDNYPGTGVDYDFQVYTNPAGGTPQLLAESGWQPSPSWRVPTGTLAWNTSYLWTVKAGDHVGESLPSVASPFSTTVQQPLITSRIGGAVGNGTTRTFDAQAGNYTTTATDASVTAVGPALAVDRTYNSLDPRTTSLFGSGWASAYDMSVAPDADGTGSVVLTTANGRTERFGRNDFQLTELAAAGDQTGDGKDDAVAVDVSNGKLWLYPGPDFSQTNRKWLGDGWDGVSRLVGGDVNGDGYGDVLAVVNWNGSLRLFPGKAGGGFGDLVTVGAAGWGGMSNLAITAPMAGDGHKDLLAVEKSTGNLYAFPFAANGTLGGGVVLGSGWNSMSELVGGDFNHDGIGDVAGIEVATGHLWMYPGTGNPSLGTSTFGAPVLMTTGWGGMRDLAPFNGLPGDTATDIVAVDKTTGVQYLHHSATQWSTATRTTTGMALYTSPSGEFETLASSADGGWQVADKTGTVYTFSQPAGNAYLLSKITDRQQHTQLLHYTGGKLDTVTDQASGRALHLTWTGDGKHVASAATDPVTGTDQSTALTWTYTYDSAQPDRLTQVCTPPAGTNTTRPCTTYTYTAGSHYRTTVLDAAPSSYWRLGEASGTTAGSEAIANQGTDNATYTGVTLGTAGGPLTGSTTITATFDGTTSSVALPSSSLGNSYLAIGLWFKTTTPGALVGYQNQPLGTAPSHASQPLYIGSDGKLRAEFYGNAIGFNPITTTGTVTDNKWHFAVLSGAGDTQTLYLDGQPAGTRTGAIDHLDTNYTYLGAGYTQGIPWPAAPTPGTGGVNHFSGQLAEAALYPHALGASTVAAQWAAAQATSAEMTKLALPSGKTKLAVTYDTLSDRATQVTDANGGTWKLNAPTVSGSEQEYRSAVLGSRPAGYWRLAETDRASQAVNTINVPRPTPNNGTYSNVTLGATGPMTGSAGAASFDGKTSWAEIPAAYAPLGTSGALALWFKTTTAGVLIGYQSMPIGAAPVSGQQWNPALYVGTDGKLHGQFWTGDAANTLASTATVTDGQWHFAVLSADTPTTQTLYLDGNASGPLNVAIRPNGDAHVYIGAGTVSSTWPAAPTTDPSAHFTGQIANVATFDHGLGFGDKEGDLFHQAANGAATYDAAVVDAHPTGYWRLADTAGNQATELLSSSALAQNQGTYSNVTLGTAGPYTTGGTTAASFNGTTSYLQLPATAVPRTGATATIEVWFKTAGPGVIYGYQSIPLGSGWSGSYNPALYVGADGKLHGQVWNGSSPNTAVSTQTVTDNAWHLATLVVDSVNGTNSQQLYIDGTATGTPVTGTTRYNGDQYAYLGAGTIKNWPSQPTDSYGHFNGQIADFAYYNYALAPVTVTNHYTAATTPAGEAVSQSANFRNSVVNSVPAAYWRLNEPTGKTVAQDTLGTALPNQDHGTYNKTTTGVTGPSGSPDGTAVSFDGTTSSLELPNDATPVKGPNSIELWFKTAQSGVLYAYQSFPLGAAHSPGADQWNPALYIGTDSKLYGTLWTGDGANALVSSQTVTDNAWHHVVLAGDDSGQNLFLDGAQTATSNTARTVYYNGSAHVYVGAGTADGGWPNHPTSTDGRFNGSIAEVAFYPSRLSPDTVSAHYKAMGSASTQTKITTASVSDPRSRTLSWQFDTLTGKLTNTTDGTGAATRYSYDTHGFPYSVTDPDGHTVTTGHDERGNPVSTTACTTPADCHTSYAAYYLDQVNPFNPANDHRVSTADARSTSSTDTTYTTTYAYNTAGDPTTVTLPATPDFPSGRTSAIAYTAGNEPAVGSTGNEPGALVASRTGLGGQTTTYAYDKAGNLTRTTSPSGLVTTYTYDNLGRPTAQTDNCTDCGTGLATITTAYTWDSLGHTLTRTDPATTDAVTGTTHTRKTTLTYDTDGNQTSQTTADTTGGDTPRTTTWTYNTTNNLLNKTTDPAGRTTTLQYDTLGNLTKKTDPAGTQWTYAYDANNHPLRTSIANYTGSPTDPVSSRTQALEARTYDPAGRLATVIDAMGRTTHTYYNDDNTVAEVDLDGYRNTDGTQRNIVLQQNTYDAAGHLTQQTTGGGKTTVTTAYDAAGRTTQTTLDPGGLNRTTAYTYDANGNVLSTVLTGGGERRESDATYNPVGQVLTQTVKNTPADTTVKNTYDQRGLPLTTVSPLGNVTGADPAAYTTTYAHDATGRLTVTTSPPVASTTVNPATGAATTLPQARAITRTGYGIYADPLSTQDPTGNVTTFTRTFDAAGEHSSVAQTSYTAPGQSTSVTPVSQIDYDVLGRAKTLHDPTNQITTNTYDQLGNLVETDRPAVAGVTPKTLYSYDLAGELLAATTPTGARTESTYDDLGRRLTTTELVRRSGAPTDAYTTAYGYDDAGNRITATGPTGATIKATFDAAGEQTTSTDPLQRTTTTAFNLAGQPTVLTLPGDQAGSSGPSTVRSYDQGGRLTRTEQRSSASSPLAATTSTYDATGNVLSSTDADGNTSTMAYDALGRPQRHTEPVTAGKTITTDFDYDLAGHRTAYTDGNRNTTYYTFNTLGLPESTIEPATSAYPNLADRTYTTAYDTLSRPTTVTQPGGVAITSTYDAASRVTAQSGIGGDVPTPTRTLGYDLDGRLTSNSGPGGTQTYTWDDRGLPTAATGPTGNSTYAYDANGQLTVRTNTAGTTSYTYDAAGQLKTLADPLTATTLTYGYTNRGQVSAVQYGTGDTRGYTYDDQGNTLTDTLKTSTGATVASLAYTYFPSGRLKTKTTTGVTGAATQIYTYDQAGRLGTWNNGASTTTYGYDGNGNLTANGINTATYNERNQLTATSTSTSYTYSPRGTRTAATAGSNTTTSTYDAFDQLTAQAGQSYTYDALGRLTQSASHTFAYDGVTSTLTADGTENYTRTPAGRLTALGNTGAASLAYTDRHGDLIGTFTPTATATAGSTAYDPWGKPTSTTGTGHNLGYQGGWTDTTTGQVNTASRWYDPATISFTTRDTANLAPVTPGIANRYTYGAGDPLNTTDPTGHSPCGSGGEAAAAAAAAAAGAATGDAFDRWMGMAPKSSLNFSHATYQYSPTIDWNAYYANQAANGYGWAHSSGAEFDPTYSVTLVSAGTSIGAGYLASDAFLGVMSDVGVGLAWATGQSSSSCDTKSPGVHLDRTKISPGHAFESAVGTFTAGVSYGLSVAETKTVSALVSSAAAGSAFASGAVNGISGIIGGFPAVYSPGLGVTGFPAGNGSGAGIILDNPIDPSAGAPKLLDDPVDAAAALGTILVSPAVAQTGNILSREYRYVSPDPKKPEYGTVGKRSIWGIPELSVASATGGGIEEMLKEAAMLRDYMMLDAAAHVDSEDERLKKVAGSTFVGALHVGNRQIAATCSGNGSCAEVNIMESTGWGLEGVIFTRAFRNVLNLETGRLFPKELEVCGECQRYFPAWQFEFGTEFELPETGDGIILPRF
ncbi:hypothetical protein GCM10010440_74820 [Kitasatospora cinereorecta]